MGLEGFNPGVGGPDSPCPPPYVEWKHYCAITKKNVRDVSNANDIQFIMVHRMIIDAILHLFIICYDLFHNGSAVFGKMPQMCCGCLDVNKCLGTDTTILRQHWPFMSIKSFVQHSG